MGAAREGEGKGEGAHTLRFGLSSKDAGDRDYRNGVDHLGSMKRMAAPGTYPHDPRITGVAGTPSLMISNVKQAGRGGGRSDIHMDGKMDLFLASPRMGQISQIFMGEI